LKPIAWLAALLFVYPGLVAQEKKASKEIALPTSKLLRIPSPGHMAALNSFPATVALSPERHYAAFLNEGYGTPAAGIRQSITILDLKTNHLADFPDERLGEDAHQSYFLGLAFGSDGKHLYASMGSITDPTGEKQGNAGNGVAVYGFNDGKVTPERFLKIPPQKIGGGKKVAYGLRKTPSGTAIPYPAGLAVISAQGADKLLVANNLSDNVVLLDSASGKILQQFDVSTHQVVPSSFPYTVVANPDGKRAWCSLWNSSKIAELDLVRGTVARWISLQRDHDTIVSTPHNTAMLFDAPQNMLFVAMSNSDRVAIVSADSGVVSGYLDTSLPGQNYAGTYPTALARSADGRYLFVADSSLNAVAVFDVPSLFAEVKRPAIGFIPTDWYPSALATVGDSLLIATAKGQGTGPNNFKVKTGVGHRHREYAYIATLLYGSLARLNYREVVKQLPELTRQVQETNLLRSDPGKIHFQGGSNPIRHVIYVLKENRTYDQILGDLKVGNGDPSLTMYGADVTPNEHKLALQFGVLDNFYDSGEVSGDGHEWSTAAITSDYNEKTWQIGYRGEERTYDFAGMVADEFPLENNQPDVDAPATGFIWDNLAAHGLTYRDYGEFVGGIWCRSEGVSSPKKSAPSSLSAQCAQAQIRKGDPLPANVGAPRGGPSPWPWAIPVLKGVKPTKAALRDHFDPNYADFNTDYPDQLRADEFLNEFEGFVRARKQGNGKDKDKELPQFVLLYLPDDHTGGTRAGKPRPAASIADNDLALGRVVEAVSHSPYWDDTAIFVVEDDAQNGADHVDAHRSIAFVISKYAPGSAERPFLDHAFYTTVNMVHTMEVLLGLPPMNQNDGYAPVMAPLFTGAGNQPAFTADWRNRDDGLIYQVNPPHLPGAKQSAKMDFSRPDAVNTTLLNSILWRDSKGNVPQPAAKHTVLPAKAAVRDDD